MSNFIKKAATYVAVAGASFAAGVYKNEIVAFAAGLVKKNEAEEAEVPEQEQPKEEGK